MAQASPRILVFQHIDCEHPGIFRDFLAEDGVAWDAVELDEGEPIPSLEGYDALWAMGGPMDVWQDEAHPWMTAEKAAIREAVVERGLPFLGLCLGHQLLAVALDGEVKPAATPEVGILEVELTEEGRSHPLFDGLAARSRCLQWHSSEVTRLPAGTRVLASSPACQVQAMVVGERAFGIQYHVELTPSTVDDWGAIPEYEAALEKALGPGALPRLAEDAAAGMAGFNAAARKLYDNFMAIAGRGRA